MRNTTVPRESPLVVSAVPLEGHRGLDMCRIPCNFGESSLDTLNGNTHTTTAVLTEQGHYAMHILDLTEGMKDQHILST